MAPERGRNPLKPGEADTGRREVVTVSAETEGIGGGGPAPPARPPSRLPHGHSPRPESLLSGHRGHSTHPKAGPGRSPPSPSPSSRDTEARVLTPRPAQAWGRAGEDNESETQDEDWAGRGSCEKPPCQEQEAITGRKPEQGKVCWERWRSHLHTPRPAVWVGQAAVNGPAPSPSSQSTEQLRPAGPGPAHGPGLSTGTRCGRLAAACGFHVGCGPRQQVQG